MKRLFFIVSMLCFIVFYGCETHSGNSYAPTTEGEIEVNILSVNDMHSAIDVFPKFAALVDSLRAAHPDLLVFSAGDNRTGNPVNDQYDPVNYPMIELMNRTGFDLCTVGNHEWDAKIDALQRDIERAEFPFLCANLSVPETVKLDVKPYAVIGNQGVRLAVVGMIELRADGLPGAHPDNMKKVRFKRAETVLPDYRHLKDESDALILLSHCGLEDDMELAKSNPWVDVIIGGHSHTLIAHPAETNGVLITQSGSHLSHATLVTLRFKDGRLVGKNAVVLSVRDRKTENAEIRKMVDGFNDAPELNKAIATAKTRFNEREEIGCMVADAMREATGADFAFQNTGGIRVNHLKKGPITVKDVYTLDPFNNEVVVYKMTGEQVKRFIVNSYKKNGGFPSYVSGMTCEVTDNGKSVSAFVRPDKGSFSTKAVYTVAINSYMASTVRIESVDEGRSQFVTTEEALIAFLKRHKEVDYQGIVRTR